jgi:hypothetical protein
VLQWLRRWWGQDDQQLVKPGPSEHLDPIEELIRVVNEAQDRDARDERRLYDPKLGVRKFFANKGGLNNRAGHFYD